MAATVTLIGLSGGHLPCGAGPALAAARLVVGFAAALNTVLTAARAGSGPGAPRTIEVPRAPGLPASALDALAAAVAAGEPAVVLVPGDPGYFGALRALRDRGLPTECLPGVTAVQRVAALIQRPWDDVCVVSAHGGAFREAANVCRARPAVGVLTGPGAGPAELAAALAGWRRTLVVLEDVGGPAEELSIVDPAEAAVRTWRGPTVVLCLSDLDRAGAPGWLAGWAPSARHDDVGGSPEMCALAQALLAPRPGTLVWDVVAGAGVVGIEAARMGAAVIAVEPDAGQCVRLRANARRSGVDIRLVDGRVPQALAGLPRPDGVFLGTARADVVRACVDAGAGRIVVEVHELGSVGPARDALADGGYAVDGRLLSSAPLRGLASGGAAVERATSTLLLWGTRR
ncbi:SAM-dependent methyltransferase [Actinophytocola sp. KF-1]